MGETSWFGKRSESELRSIRAETLYEFEMECRSREAGWGDPAFVYDEVRDLFRFTNGRFAFSRKHAECYGRGVGYGEWSR